MLVSTKWLEEYVNTQGLPPAELGEKITRAGIEVDAVIDRSEGLANLVVGYVTECVKHPEADKLSICQVGVGGGEIDQIICGAPNIAQGQSVIVARPGAKLPGGMKIKKAKLRGEVSNGMICSLQELGIETKLVPKSYAEGIYVLPEKAEPGTDVLSYLDLDDTVLELGLTPNRADAMSMLGVAYEVGAILEEDVSLPEIVYAEAAERAESMLSLEVDAPEANPLYVAKVVRNVKVKESPLWLQQRLMAAGVRPHNNVVDVTNYILMEYGQPLHAFDYDSLGSGNITVRHAKEGEKITTLDDTERTLSAHQLVITNGTDPVALAGVMGGANSEVSEDTTTVVIESAYFASDSIRRTSKDHNLRSDASSRYEKGVDPNRVIPAAERAAQLLAELADGEVLGGSLVFDQLDKKERIVKVSPDFINSRLGMKIRLEDMLDILSRLKFNTEAANNQLIIEVPTRRQDIQIEEDVVEEIARLYGYDEIPATLPRTDATPGGLSPYQAKRRIARHFLEGAGLLQATTYSLTSEAAATQFALEPTETTRLLMPMSEERSILRQSLLPHLLESLSYNTARRTDSVALYETGSVFLKGQDELLDEQEHLAIVMTGLWVDHSWQGEKKVVDFFVAKGIVEGLAAKLGLELSFERGEMDGLHPGRTAFILLDGKRIGVIGALHPSEQKKRDLKETIAVELNLATLLTRETEALVYIQVSRYPTISRDVALVLSNIVEAQTIEGVIRNAGGKLLKDVRVFDLYEGDRMEEGKKSLAFSLTYFDPEKTLTDDEVNAAHEKIIKALTESGAELR
ncbi:phenylalanine--tRNA ligase subunit beta [Planococcus sp. CP5-4]|uniref:phenylalanine--tRNA ligase subunit beta n=1 Tax=unclassified Planococcus (in: firmicutes) TaxID=2662419 RepID=UPI001C223C39|nr:MULTISPECIES: phenylalanine--tRNA ligase subunit beta [unclassified Planococcus (in: firmicutes)]MBU9672951.1 phenylalanine--tRNA ligase subunit beta [Planococcus sp. CP5-4_YE]MBV0908723.1 phenylalanine--tRNA ligase subunit beta [Planococcus sp. CP5-4_UN]MBW6063492.1 phenylalanine--tRNA ligase subunit beta [Planococcus sp. CP5-4]